MRWPLVFLAIVAGCHPAREAILLGQETGASSSGLAAVNGTTLWYEVAGQGSPVVLLHGGQLDHRMWDEQFALLARSHRVVCYDERGFGRSGAADSAFAAHEDLFALIRYLGIDRASLVGLSLGGRIAIDFALEHPEMVDRLVLAAPGLSGWTWTPESRDVPWRQDARAAVARHDTTGVALAWLRSAYMQPAMEQRALAPRLRALAADNVGAWKSLLRHGDLERDASPPALGRLAAIHAPTLVIVGTRDVPDIRQIADTLVADVPGARKLVLVGAGHMVNLEQPSRFNAAVVDFLSR